MQDQMFRNFLNLIENLNKVNIMNEITNKVERSMLFYKILAIVRKLKLAYCKTYKVIKAYIGFAKRDLKQINKDKSKLFHANRGLYCAQELLEGRLPLLSEIQKLALKDGYFQENLGDLIYTENLLRTKLNKLYDDNKIVTYYIEKCGNMLFDKMFEANNIKEFKY